MISTPLFIGSKVKIKHRNDEFLERKMIFEWLCIHGLSTMDGILQSSPLCIPLTFFIAHQPFTDALQKKSRWKHRSFPQKAHILLGERDDTKQKGVYLLSMSSAKLYAKWALRVQCQQAGRSMSRSRLEIRHPGGGDFWAKCQNGKELWAKQMWRGKADGI